jgi:raffinose/stachyose/melibiose transport system substrate-binding protein
MLFDQVNKQAGIIDKLKTGESKWTDPGLKRVFSQFNQLVDKGYILEGKGSAGIGYDQAVLAFQQEKAAMWVMGSWSLDKFPADFKTFNIGVMPLPVNDTGTPLIVPQTVDQILSGVSWSKHQDAVKKFLEFAASQEAGSLQSTEQKVISTVKGAASEFSPWAKLWNPLFEQATSMTGELDHLTAGALGEVTTQLQNLLVAGKTVDQVADAVQKVQEKDNQSSQ